MGVCKYLECWFVPCTSCTCCYQNGRPWRAAGRTPRSRSRRCSGMGSPARAPRAGRPGICSPASCPPPRWCWKRSFVRSRPAPLRTPSGDRHLMTQQQRRDDYFHVSNLMKDETQNSTVTESKEEIYQCIVFASLDSLPVSESSSSSA